MILVATMDVLARNGADGTSLRSVCREMDVAPSLMARYFNGWHEQLAATQQLIAENCLAELTAILRVSYPSEQQRAREFIQCCLSSRWIGADMVAAIMALWEMARSVPDLQVGFEQFFGARCQLLAELLKRVSVEAGATISVQETAMALLLLVDGIWMHRMGDPAGYCEQDALDICWAWVADRLGKPEWRGEGK